MPLVSTESGHQWFINMDGHGQSVVFIHGWAADSRIWVQQFQHFSEKFCVVTVDLPGHGQTPWQDLSLEGIASDIAEILRQKGLRRPILIGSSFGGLVGLKIYELFPHEVGGLIFVGSQPKFFQSADYPWGLAPARIAKLREQLENEYPAIVPIFFRSLFTAKERASERFKWLQSFRKNDDVPQQEALLRLIEVLTQADLRAVLRQVRVPMQFIHGAEDPICPKEVYAHLEKEYPAAGFDAMAGCGHFPFVSRPTEFNQILEKFLFRCGE